MISKFLTLLFAAAVGVSSVAAQITLENFSSFLSPKTLFYGEWAASGDPFAGDPTPAATFSQAVGVFNFKSTTNADSAYVERTFASPMNLSGYDLLTVSARLLPDNTATTVTVILFDQSFRAAMATFQTSAFNAPVATQQSVALTADVGFSFGAVSQFRISGNDLFASGVFSVALDNLAVARSSVQPPVLTAVPEPAVYGLAAIGTLIAAVTFTRARRRNAV